MIRNKDRSGWFGASDTKYVMGNWETSTFIEWWQTKLGIKKNTFSNVYTIAGTNIEHRLAENYSETNNVKIKLDRQIKIKKYKLRVNLDCETKKSIIEIKTYKYKENWKLPKEYIWQVQVQMFATGKREAYIYAYGLEDEDYNNFYRSIDSNRLNLYPIEYQKNWIDNEFLPRLIYLKDCLKKRKTPNINEFKGEKYEIKKES